MLGRAREYFPPQESIYSFDPLLGLIIAWDRVIHNVAESWPHLDDEPDLAANASQNSPLIVAFKKAGDAENGQTEEAIDAGSAEESCGIEWERRDEPVYPRDALFRGTVGTVLVGYRFTDDLAPQDISVIAEAPFERFSDLAVEAVRNWRLSSPAPDRPECRENQMVEFNYQIAR